MTNILYSALAVFLFWAPLGSFLYGIYYNRYNDDDELFFNLDRDMKTWSPVVVALLALTFSEGALVTLCTVGVAFEGYAMYSGEEGSVSMLKDYLGKKK